MNQSIYPCLWFENNASEAVGYYTTIFSNAKSLQISPLAETFQLMGTKFMALNGGPANHVNGAVSYFVYCGDEAETERLYYALTDGGSVLMPLDRYDWSAKYAWISDKYGVNWQIDSSDIGSEQKIAPCLLFANAKKSMLKDAIRYYMHIFSPAEIIMEAPYPESSGMPGDMILFAQFCLKNLIFNSMSSILPHNFDFTPVNSFVVECKDQAEIDYYWQQLGENGQYQMCGWLTDRYGVSWQIIPAVLPLLLSNPEKAPRVIAAFLKMKKFELEILLMA